MLTRETVQLPNAGLSGQPAGREEGQLVREKPGGGAWCSRCTIRGVECACVGDR